MDGTKVESQGNVLLLNDKLGFFRISSLFCVNTISAVGVYFRIPEILVLFVLFRSLAYDVVLSMGFYTIV